MSGPGAPSDAVDVRLDVMATATAAVWMVREDARPDPVRSVSAGMLVFQGHSSLWRSGLHFAGVVLLPNEDPGYERTDAMLFAHERVHALQYDQAFLALGEPMERWVFEQVGQPAGVARWLDLNVTAPLFPLVRHFGYEPWEDEAHFLVEPYIQWILRR